ncbi:hypothetical protein EBS40_09880, partial [bacterium]|nr:hypothetical protein [bacterium]
GGGGGGGSYDGGGGGGGDVTEILNVALNAGTYTITVGDGGNGGVYTSYTSYSAGNSGGTSSITSSVTGFVPLYAAGGGGGSSGSNISNKYANYKAPNPPLTAGNSTGGNGGIKGTQGGYGALGNPSEYGDGGTGQNSSVSGNSTWYGGGGGSGFSGRTGIHGGGTGGQYSSNRNGLAGTANTGGGGGGGCWQNGNGGKGGSGIVIIRISPPINCVWGPNEWSPCSSATTCDGINPTRTGTRTRTFRRTTEAANGGTCAEQPSSNSESCILPCPVNCVWGPNDWSPCEATCDGINPTRAGTITRTFSRTREAANGGTCVVQPSSNQVPCIKINCPVNCAWNTDPWGQCEAICDGINPTRTGTRTRIVTKTREATNGGTCAVQPSSSESCTKTNCPVDCAWNIDPWGQCEATCDGINPTRTGTRTRIVTK